MPDVTLRALTLRDTDAILEIDSRVTGQKRRHVDNDLWRLIAETTTCYGAESNGKLVGFVLADVRPWEFGVRSPVGWIIALGVLPSHQGKGVGRMLGDRVLSSFRALGVTQFKTLCDSGDKDLLAYFESLGFRPGAELVLSLAGNGTGKGRTAKPAKAKKTTTKRR